MDELTLNIMSLLDKRKQVFPHSACPWCNGKEISMHEDEGMHWCHCDNCGADGPPALTEVDALESWERKDG